jgi:hypothetical protein
MLAARQHRPFAGLGRFALGVQRRPEPIRLDMVKRQAHVRLAVAALGDDGPVGTETEGEVSVLDEIEHHQQEQWLVRRRSSRTVELEICQTLKPGKPC